MRNLKSRTEIFGRNATISVLHQLLTVLLGFIVRTAFITSLGVEILGLHSLLLSIVALLAFADLGINGAIMYALYKPLGEGDTKRVTAIVRYAGFLFRWVALIVLLIGIFFTPFVHVFVKLETDVSNLELYYLVLIANTVAGYLMLNRLALLDADQKIYVTKLFSIIFEVIRVALQVIVLLLFHSFFVFLLIQVVATFGKNLAIYLKAGRIYPYIRHSQETLAPEEQKQIRESVKAMLIFRIAGLIMGSAPPMLISLIIGTLALGYYANYMLIISAATAVTQVIFQALTPSIGNLIADRNSKSARRTFDELVIASILIHGVIAVGLQLFLNDFITVWIGEEFLLPNTVIAAATLNFYITGIMMPIWSFRSATGLFRKTQWVMVLTAVLSLILAVALGVIVGLAGIIIAPAIARLLTGGWYEPFLLIRKHLAGPLASYFVIHVVALFLWITLIVCEFFFLGKSPVEPPYDLVLKVIYFAVVAPLSAWIAFGRLTAFKSLRRRGCSLMRSKLSRKSSV